MLFVYDQGFQPGKWQQYGRARTNKDYRLAITDFQPSVQAFAVVQGGMPHQNALAEIALEPGNGLRCQVNFWHQYQRLVLRREVLF